MDGRRDGWTDGQTERSVLRVAWSQLKIAFWPNGLNHAGYREYTIDKLLEALEIILLNTYIQFNGCIFKQIPGIPMGGNASLFILTKV